MDYCSTIKDIEQYQHLGVRVNHYNDKHIYRNQFIIISNLLVNFYFNSIHHPLIRHINNFKNKGFKFILANMHIFLIIKFSYSTVLLISKVTSLWCIKLSIEFICFFFCQFSLVWNPASCLLRTKYILVVIFPFVCFSYENTRRKAVAYVVSIWIWKIHLKTRR